MVASLLLLGCDRQSIPKSAISEKRIKDSLCIHSLCPKGDYDNDQIVDHGLFILANNEESKFADWVAYKVENKNLNGPKRERRWRQDPELSDDDTLPPSAYKGVHALLGTDRGHFAPLASFKGNKDYYTVNYLSNISPQKSELNQGPWRELEESVRKLSKGQGTVYVVTGPYYSKGNKPSKRFPNYTDAVIIPDGYFKVVMRESKGKVKATAFLMPQSMARNADFCDTITSEEQVDRKTGLDILPDINLAGHLNRELGCRT